MVVVSVLRAATASRNNLFIPLNRLAVKKLSAPGTSLGCVPVRGMGGHKRTIQILPSRFEYNKWKDHLHFYVLLGVIPLSAAVMYANLTIGDAELADIPDDYEPKYWEYYKHPVSRLLAKWFFEPPERVYEMNLHFIELEQKKVEARKLEKKVKALMQERGDYKAWYYVPFNDRHVYAGRRDKLEQEYNTNR